MLLGGQGDSRGDSHGAIGRDSARSAPPPPTRTSPQATPQTPYGIRRPPPNGARETATCDSLWRCGVAAVRGMGATDARRLSSACRPRGASPGVFTEITAPAGRSPSAPSRAPCCRSSGRRSCSDGARARENRCARLPRRLLHRTRRSRRARCALRPGRPRRTSHPTWSRRWRRFDFAWSASRSGAASRS